MISCVQCCVPDLNCDSASSVWHTGPQPRLCEFSVACRTAPVMERIGSSCRKSGQRSSCKMSQDKSDRMSGDMFARRSERKCQREWSKICQECQKVDLHHEDQERLRHRETGFCHFVPEYMAKGIWVKLLKGKSSPMEDALLETWEGQFENASDHTDDAKTLFFVELMHADFKMDLKIGEENEKIEVIRWQFPLLHGMLRTAYSAQGLTLDGGALGCRV